MLKKISLKAAAISLIFAFISLNAAEGPGFANMKLYIDMDVQQVNESLAKFSQKIGNQFSYQKITPSMIASYGTNGTRSLSYSDMMNMDFSDAMRQMQAEALYEETISSLKYDLPPLSYVHELNQTYLICKELSNKKLRHVKSSVYYLVRDKFRSGIIVLGFSRDKLTEIIVSGRLFNFQNYPIGSVLNMLSREWKVKFPASPVRRFGTGVSWHTLSNDKFVVSVTQGVMDGNSYIYIGKTVPESSAQPSLHVSAAQEQYYTCKICSVFSDGSTNKIASGNSGNNTMTAIPASSGMNSYSGLSMGGGSGRSGRTAVKTPCPSCKGTRINPYRYIEAPIYSGKTIYKWCDICRREVKLHTHTACRVCKP